MSELSYNYQPRQAFVGMHNRTQRWGVVIAHRRSGKTYSLLNDIIVRALHKRPDGLRDQFAYMCPFQNQARAVAWEYLKALTAPFSKCAGYSISEMNLTVTLPDPTNVNKKGANIMLLGAENAEKLRGILPPEELEDLKRGMTAEAYAAVIADVVQVNSDGTERKPYTDRY